MGMINLLVVGVYVVYISAVLLLLYMFIYLRYKLIDVLKEFMSIGVVFFIVGVIFFYFVLRAKNAIFRDWDEFSFWGTAAKTVFYYDKLYTFVPVSFPLSYPPALPVFSYFTQFFSRSFSEFRTYVAYDIMIVAALAPMFSRVKYEQVLSIVTISSFSYMGIYAFFHASEGLRAYATSYADMQIGFLFAGALLIWFSDDKNKPIRYFASLALLSVIALCKDIGFAVSFIAAFIIMIDMYLSSNYPSDIVVDKYTVIGEYALPCLFVLVSIPLFLLVSTFYGVAALLVAAACFALLRFVKHRLIEWVKGKGKFIFRIFFTLLLFITLIVVYRLWAIHYQALRSVSRDATYRYSILEVLSGKNPVFNLVYNEMMYRLVNHSIVCFGTILEMILVFTIIPIIVSVFTWKKSNVLRLSAFSLLMCLGFIAYYMFHAYLFTTQFPNTYFYEQFGTIDLGSFNRYISSYAIGWMFAIIGVLYLEVAKPLFKTNLMTFVMAIIVTTLMVLSIFYYTPDHYDQYFITSNKVIVSESGPRPVIRKHLSRIRSEFTNDDKIYFISFSTDGGEWFCVLYEAFPAMLQQELGYFVPTNTKDVGLREVALDSKGFSDYLRENNVNMVYVNYRIDDYFLEEFSHLFEDNLAYTFDDSARVYYVVDELEEEVKLVPILNSQQLKDFKGE